MAKRPPPEGVGRRPEIDDYRRELVRLVRRQLDCARMGTIGSPAWKLAFGRDLDQIEDCHYWTKIPHPVPVLTVPAFIERGQKRTAEWSMIDSTPSPMAERDWGMRWHVYRIDASRPDALEAVNQLAARVIAEWLEWMEAEEAEAASRDDDFMPANYFKGVQITQSKLRDWKRRGRLQASSIRKRGRENLYNVVDVLRLNGSPLVEGRKTCDESWKKRNASGRT